MSSIYVPNLSEIDQSAAELLILRPFLAGALILPEVFLKTREPICTKFDGNIVTVRASLYIEFNKKLCYRKEDSASVVLSWFSSLSALFSVTYGLDIPDFSNWCLSRAHLSSIGHISAFWQGTSHRCLSIMPSFSVTSANIAINDTSLKTRFFGLHPVAVGIGVSSTIFM